MKLTKVHRITLTDSKVNSGKNRRLFIGDIHGCHEELFSLLKNFNFDNNRDQIYSVGDLVGKGPGPGKVIDTLQKLGARGVLGNHDINFLRCVENDSQDELRNRYPFWHEQSDSNKKKSWLTFLKSWPLAIDFDDITLVHAGIQPGKKALEDMDEKVLVSIRSWDGMGKNLNNPESDPYWFDCVKWPKTIVFGHWAALGGILKKKLKGLDFGCVYGNQLKAWCPEEDRYYSAKSKKIYSQPNVHKS